MENKNKVELLGYYGSDETHACSAWTSTSRELDEEKRKRIPAMLTTLAKAGHHTPFEKSGLHFLVTTDIATHIHILKHRIGVSVNGESARYKELQEDKFLIPTDWANVPISEETKKKLGIDVIQTWGEVLENHSILCNDLYHAATKELTVVLGRKRAKESARFFKGYNSQIDADVMFNWRSFQHFQGLRNKPEAQVEVHDIAEQMLELVKNIEGKPFQHTIDAFAKC